MILDNFVGTDTGKPDLNPYLLLSPCATLAIASSSSGLATIRSVTDGLALGNGGAERPVGLCVSVGSCCLGFALALGFGDCSGCGEVNSGCRLSLSKNELRISVSGDFLNSLLGTSLDFFDGPSVCGWSREKRRLPKEGVGNARPSGGAEWVLVAVDWIFTALTCSGVFGASGTGSSNKSQLQARAQSDAVCCAY